LRKVLLVAGARPNFMKIAPIMRAIESSSSLKSVLVHTGQHYDHSMSGTFFKGLGIKEPDFNLEVGSSSHAVQTAHIMIRFEEVCLKEKPDIVLVVGDVNSTIAAGLVAKKLNIPLAHVEAGLRSGDRLMPEEINRIATDAISDIFFTTEKTGSENLLQEGQHKDKIHFVGHVMIDNLFFQLEKLKSSAPSPFVKKIKEQLPEKYFCMTMHRPSNVDNKEKLEKLLTAIRNLSTSVPVVFPCHPRTKNNMEQFSFLENFTILENEKSIHSMKNGLYLTNPLDYNDFLYLWKDCSCMLTDSGGLQEETTALKIPCITMRDSTERPITVDLGSNYVVGDDVDQIAARGEQAVSGTWKESHIPEFWDGKASERIVSVIEQLPAAL